MSTTKPRRGRFVTFEGPDGSGKSTQARLLAARLREMGREVLETADTGGTPIGMQIRRVLLDAKNRELRPTAELLLMFAGRAQNIDQWILPALAQGQFVISDRFTDSTLVYQGVARGLGAEVVYEVDRIACRGLVPDLTLVIDIDAAIGLDRAHSRNREKHDIETRMEEQDVSFHRKVREAYHQLAAEDARRIRIIDGARSEALVAQDVWEAMRSLIEST